MANSVQGGVPVVLAPGCGRLRLPGSPLQSSAAFLSRVTIACPARLPHQPIHPLHPLHPLTHLTHLPTQTPSPTYPPTRPCPTPAAHPPPPSPTYPTTHLYPTTHPLPPPRSSARRSCGAASWEWTPACPPPSPPLSPATSTGNWRWVGCCWVGAVDLVGWSRAGCCHPSPCLAWRCLQGG